MSMDVLVTALLDLAAELPELPQPILIGGGFGLYLKQRYLEERQGLDTLISGEHWAPARATKDIDVFLPTEIIISADHMRSIRTALDRLGYVPEVEYFQFVKETPQGIVKIDLLTCDVPEEQSSKVKINPPRVRPVEKVRLHAYLTKEALALGLASFELTLSGQVSAGEAATLTVHVPNPFTYLLMKLHAFRDRLHDARKDMAAHHAVDIYRIVSMLTREEFELVRSLSASYSDAEPVVEAASIVRSHFAASHAVGVLRLRAGLKDAVRWSDKQSLELASALTDLFPEFWKNKP